MGPGGSGRTRRRAAVATAGVVVLLAGALAVVLTVEDFSGHCVGTAVRGAPTELVGLDAVVTDPLHLAASDTTGGTTPKVGDTVSVGADVVPPPGTRGVITAVVESWTGDVALTITLPPLAQVGGFPGTPPMPTMRPGATTRVTLESSGAGTAWTVGGDALRSAPDTVPGPGELWPLGPGPGDDMVGGRAHPRGVTVERVVGDRAVVASGYRTDPLGAADAVPVAVPDRLCRTAGVWPPVLHADRRWSTDPEAMR